MSPVDAADGLPVTPTPRQLIAGTDWEQLEVLVGPEQGCSPVPELLMTLVEGTPPARGRALRDLCEAVNHQNSIVEATAPALLVAAALLTDPGTDRMELPAIPHRINTPVSLREGLLLLIAGAVDDAGDKAEAAGLRLGWPLAAAQRQVRATRPALLGPVCTLLDDPDPEVRQAAALAVIPLLEDPTLASQHPDLRDQAKVILSTSTNPRHRARVDPEVGQQKEVNGPIDGGFDDDPPF